MNHSPRLVLLLSLSVCAANAAPVFRNPLPVRHAANWVTDLASADFNGDGYEDVLIVDNQQSFNVVLSNGTGTSPFGAPKATPVSDQNGRPAIGDVTGDGKRDIVYADRGTGAITILRGNGDGTFTVGGSFVAPVQQPGPVAVADFNGDGLADVAVTSEAPGHDLSVHFGDGAGQFTSGTVTTTGDFGGLHAADLNGDGRADLVTTYSGANAFLSNGNGTFTFAHSVPVPARDVAFADFNHDGKLDLALAVQTSIQVALGNGQGGFGQPAAYIAAHHTDAIDAADVDGDGNVDLFGAGNLVTVLRGNAGGTFDAPEYLLPGANRIAVADFDRDGARDLATLVFDDSGALGFVHGNGDGTFAAYRAMHTRKQVEVIPLNLHTGAPVLADMNEDGRPDVVTLQEQPQSVSRDFALSVLLNDGGGNLATPILSDTQTRNWNGSPGHDVADLDGDGWLDAVVVSNSAGPQPVKVVSLLGNGDGTFDPPVELAVSEYGAPKLAHFNGDANADLLVAGHDRVTVYPGNGNGTFGAAIQSAVNGAVLYGDLNGDGKMDFVSADSSPTAYINDGTGRFTPSQITSWQFEAAALADFDGDARLDVLLATNAGTEMWSGNGNGTFRDPVRFGIWPVPRPPLTATAADFDGDGKIDAGFGTAVYLSNGDGTFRARAHYRTDATFVAAGDLDANGSADLVFVNTWGDDVGVLLTRTSADPAAAPGIALAPDKPVAQYAEPVKLEAAVTGGDVPLTGVVVFSNGGTGVAIAPVDAGGKASFTTAFPVGSHTITARYAGDEYHREASASAGLAVTKAKPMLSIAGSPNPVPSGSFYNIYVQFFALRDPMGLLAPPGGTIVVRQGQTPVGSPLQPRNGTSAVSGPRTLPAGSHVFHADYPGDANYEAVTASYTQEISKPVPSMGLSTAPAANDIFAGQPVTIRTTLPSDATGSVTFFDGGIVLGTVALTSGVAELAASFSWGSHTIRVAYPGNAGYAANEKTMGIDAKIGPWGTPLQVRARADGGGGLSISWSKVEGGVTYKLWRRTALASSWVLEGSYGSGTSGISTHMTANTTRLYAVSAVDANGAESALSAPDLATAITFADATITPRATRVKAVHLAEVRAAIGYVRTFAGLPAFSYTNTVAPGQRIRRADLTETRTALAQARSAIGLPAIAFTDAAPANIRAVHVTELRGGVD